MFKRKKTGKKVCAGIDIGSYSIKVLEAVIEQDTRTITKFAINEIPPNSSSESLRNILKTTVGDAELTAKEVNTSLSGPNAIVRFINMPEMGQQELKNSLRYEAEKYIPFSIDDVNIDSSILGKTKNGKGHMGVLLAAAKKELVDRRMRLIAQLGLNVSLIDVDAFAVFNAFLVSEKDIDSNSSVAILNLGHRSTNVVISKGNMPYFTRDIQIGGEHIAKNVAKQTNIDETKVFNADQENRTVDLKEPIKNSLSKLGDEIRLSFGYYENQHGSSVEKVYLSGGFSNVKEIPEYFEHDFGIKPIQWDPLRAFTIAPTIDKAKIDAVKSSLAVACGLVVRTNI